MLCNTQKVTIYYFILVKDINNVLLVILITLILSLVGEFGDLIKSTIKRCEEVKDFSNLIPGHGGVMDRINGLIVNAVVVFIVLVICF